MQSAYKIAVVGLWHLGEIFSACLADMGHQVVGISEDAELVANFGRNVPPLPEPELAEILAKNQASGHLSYSTDFGKISGCNVLWFTFDTPVDDRDEVDLEIIYETLDKSLPYLQDGVLIVMTSQVPAGTGQEIRKRIKQARPDLEFGYACTPENLRLGEAVRCFREPGRVVVGAETEDEFCQMEEIFSGLQAEILKMSTASAEMAKHALNAFLATSVSFSNDIADACEKVGADVLDVVRALRSDARIGPKAFLSAGLGFSGGTLGRDLRALLKLAREKNLSLPVIQGVWDKNNLRKNMVLERLKQELGDIAGKTVAILGLTYKAGTKTLRRSRALEIAQDLLQGGAKVRLHDPQADESEVLKMVRVEFFSSPAEAARGAQAIVLITPWPEFKHIDASALASAAPGALFLDTANFLWESAEKMRAVGLKYTGVGRSTGK